MRFELTIPEQKFEVPFTLHHYLGRIATPFLCMQQDKGDRTLLKCFPRMIFQHNPN